MLCVTPEFVNCFNNNIIWTVRKRDIMHSFMLINWTVLRPVECPARAALGPFRLVVYHLTTGSIFLLFKMLGSFLLDSRRCEPYLVGCWVFVFFWVSVSLLLGGLQNLEAVWSLKVLQDCGCLDAEPERVLRRVCTLLFVLCSSCASCASGLTGGNRHSAQLVAGPGVSV